MSDIRADLGGKAFHTGAAGKLGKLFTVPKTNLAKLRTERCERLTPSHLSDFWRWIYASIVTPYVVFQGIVRSVRNSLNKVRFGGTDAQYSRPIRHCNGKAWAQTI